MSDDIEKERQDDLARLFNESELREESFLPGTFGCHEAMHEASLIEGLTARLCDSRAVVIDPEFYAQARKAHDAIFDLYQMIAAKHLSAIP